MAFGRIRRQRKKDEARFAEEENRMRKEIEAAQDPTKASEEYRQLQSSASDIDAEDLPRREGARERYKEQAMSDISTETPGISEERKLAMRESANNAINNQIANYSRNIASQTSGRGIRGGAAMAPQVELARKGLDAQNQFQRDLIEKDEDVVMQKLAAYLASVEGQEAQDVLRKQQYMDYISGRRDQGKQDVYGRYQMRNVQRV